MKTTMLLIATMLLSACASTTYTNKWTIHPDDRQRFEADYRRCTAVANEARGGESTRDNCLQIIGYKLDVIAN